MLYLRLEARLKARLEARLRKERRVRGERMGHGAWLIFWRVGRTQNLRPIIAKDCSVLGKTVFTEKLQIQARSVSKGQPPRNSKEI